MHALSGQREERIHLPVGQPRRHKERTTRSICDEDGGRERLKLIAGSTVHRKEERQRRRRRRAWSSDMRRPRAACLAPRCALTLQIRQLYMRRHTSCARSTHASTCRQPRPIQLPFGRQGEDEGHVDAGCDLYVLAQHAQYRTLTGMGIQVGSREGGETISEGNRDDVLCERVFK